MPATRVTLLPMVGRYWRLVARRAAIEAAATIGIRSRVQIVIWLGVAAIAILALLLWGSADASWDEFVWRGAFALLIVLIYPFVFVWKLLAVPAQLDANKNIENRRLAAVNTAKQHGIQRARMLTVLLEQGQDMLTEEIAVESFSDWRDRLKKWEVLTLKFLASMYSHQQASAFKFIEYNPGKKFVRAINDDHQTKFLKTMERCRYLRTIIDRDPSTWSTLSSAQRAETEAALLAFQAKVLTADRT